MVKIDSHRCSVARRTNVYSVDTDRHSRYLPSYTTSFDMNTKRETRNTKHETARQEEDKNEARASEGGEIEEWRKQSSAYTPLDASTVVVATKDGHRRLPNEDDSRGAPASHGATWTSQR